MAGVVALQAPGMLAGATPIRKWRKLAWPPAARDGIVEMRYHRRARAHDERGRAGSRHCVEARYCHGAGDGGQTH